MYIQIIFNYVERIKTKTCDRLYIYMYQFSYLFKYEHISIGNLINHNYEKFSIALH